MLHLWLKVLYSYSIVYMVCVVSKNFYKNCKQKKHFKKNYFITLKKFGTETDWILDERDNSGI